MSKGFFSSVTQYVRFDHELPLNVLYEHYRSSWPTDIYPEIAITFLGGGEELLVTEKIEEAFTQCISKVNNHRANFRPKKTPINVTDKENP